MIPPITIKKAFKKIGDEWLPFHPRDIKDESDIDGVVVKTAGGNLFKIIMKKLDKQNN
jgi:hypothetical protein